MLRSQQIDIGSLEPMQLERQVGKAFFHYVFSPDPEDYCTGEMLAEIAKKLATFLSKCGGCFQTIYAVHITNTDTGELLDLPHIHFVVNNIDFINGTRLDLSEPVLYAMIEGFDQISRSYGLSAIKKWMD